MAEASTTKATLRVFTPESSLDFVSAALGVLPAQVHLKGEPRSKRNPQSTVYEESVWLYDSELPDCSELHEHIDALLTLLERNADRVANIRQRITSMDIFCMYSSDHGQGSAILQAELIRRLAKHDIDLIMDLYPPN
jgi:hypothetical protein